MYRYIHVRNTSAVNSFLLTPGMYVTNPLSAGLLVLNVLVTVYLCLKRSVSIFIDFIIYSNILLIQYTVHMS